HVLFTELHSPRALTYRVGDSESHRRYVAKYGGNALRNVVHRMVSRTRKFVFILGALLLMLAPQGPVYTQQQPPPDALSFFKNFFVSGGYVAGGIDFGSQSGNACVVAGGRHFEAQ